MRKDMRGRPCAGTEQKPSHDSKSFHVAIAGAVTHYYIYFRLSPNYFKDSMPRADAPLPLFQRLDADCPAIPHYRHARFRPNQASLERQGHARTQSDCGHATADSVKLLVL
jgi:hypothetical protein